jgi:D-beta-D-heptose 7-phosphate kinase/D-beta-D-heptose 1-phosphate adenosyltransferase
MTAPPDRLSRIVDAFRDKRIIVLGDIMLDAFTWGRVSRISPEAPVPIVEVTRETHRPGGSANVTANIRALGGIPLTIAVLGRDASGERLRSLFEEEALESRFLVEADRSTTLKTRIIAHSQQVVRADREDRSPLDEAVNRALRDRFMEALPGSDAIVISDYDKGVVTPQVLAAVLPAAESAGIPVFLDPKVPHADYYRPVTVITPNHREAEAIAGFPLNDQESLERAGRALLDRFGCPWVLITRGSEGMSLFSPGEAHHMPAEAREVFDVSGAGDTVIATLALARAAGADFPDAARLANHAAGIVVGKIGTAVVGHDELRNIQTA